jgi:transcriptional regulator with XRE-family HTH domain
MNALDREALLGLPNLERAEALLRLLEQNNWQQRDLANHLGISIDKVSRFLMPLKLSEKVRDSIRSNVDKRPPLGSVELLCRLTPALQEELLKILPPALSEKKQILWIRKELSNRGISLSKARYRRKYTVAEVDRLTLRLGAVARKVRWYHDIIRNMTIEGRYRALAVAEYPTRKESLLKSVRILQEELRLFEVSLELSDAGKSSLDSSNDTNGAHPKKTIPNTSSETSKTSTPVPCPPKPIERALRTPESVQKIHAQEKPILSLPVKAPVKQTQHMPVPPVVKRERPQREEKKRDVATMVPVKNVLRAPPRLIPQSYTPMKIPQKIVSAVNFPRPLHVPAESIKQMRDITVSHWDENLVRIVLDKVSPQEYVEIARKGFLKYQRLKTERPDHLPDPEEVAKELGLPSLM